MTDRELMQMALDALEEYEDGQKVYFDDEIEALRARLAQPEPEPVAWMYNGNLHEFDPSDWAEGEIIPLYTAPPQREWQGLSMEDLTNETDITNSSNKDIFDFRKAFWCGARWAEAKLKGKNA